ncbi:MAG: hypothetical protein F6K42_25885 [Leptolyngbya sp. SIO1D8]|nr:hypothetical protein [Leptolyngbya sp. SIO1D8]
MKLTCKTAIAASLVTLTTVAWSAISAARPYPDQAGVCYFYRGETQEILEPCVISSGYGAGAHYAILHWSDGVETNITLINFCPDENFDDRGFCRYTVDDYDAEPYERNIFLEITALEDPENMPCYRVIETGNSVCYRFNE